MRQTLRRILVLLLSAVLMLPNADSIIAYALEEPFDRSELSTPEELQDGSSWYFIHQGLYTVSETSGDKLYIPVQRTGDLSKEGDVSLKLVDVTARHDVNYKEEMYRENPDVEIDLADISILDLVESADYQEEIDEVSEEELEEAIAEGGGADFVDAEGNVIGEVTAEQLDENGNPIVEETQEVPSEEEVLDEETPAEEEVIPQEETPAEEVVSEEETPAEEIVSEEEIPSEEVTAQPEGEWVALESDPASDEAEWEEEELSAPEALRKAREDFTGTVSDRQQMEEGDGFVGLDPAAEEDTAELVEDSMPGKVYKLHFDAGEDAKYLVITPLYDSAADGDAQMMLMLKDPDENSQIAENYRVSSVNFLDEDEQKAVQVSMAEEIVVAEDGVAAITVTREGLKNSLVGVHMSSWGGSAVMGEDYSGIGADLYFPMGVTSRTVDVPVAESEEQKDFYVTLTTTEGSDTEIERQTVHVVIPASGQAANMTAALQASASDTIRLGESINVRDSNGQIHGWESEYINDGKGFSVQTKPDSDDWTGGGFWFMTPSYFYDGLLFEYGTYLNYCDARIDFKIDKPGRGRDIESATEEDGGWHGGRTKYFYFPEEGGSSGGTVEIVNIDDEGFGIFDDYCRLVVDSITPIVRRFKITVTDGVMIDGSKPFFASMDAAGIREQTAVILNDGTDSSCTIWGGETFSISQLNGQKYVRLAAIDAVSSNGTACRIAVSDGTSQTLVGTLDMTTVDRLGAMECITWVRGPGGPNGDSKSKQGNITVRPVFEYYNAKVEIKESRYGNLVTSVKPSPALLWDFNGDKAMNNAMSAGSLNHMKLEAKDDYYTFTATENDPQVAILTGADDVSDIQWVKVRARTSSKAEAIELFGKSAEADLNGSECTHIDLIRDGQWHTYLINIPEENVKTANAYKGASLEETAWKGRIQWIRLDPMWNKADSISEGDSIDIDYIAFFETKEVAESYREGDSEETVLVPGVYNFHIGDVLDLRTQLSEAGEQAGLNGDGVRYNLFTQRNGEDIGRGTIAYANDTATLKLRGTSEDETRTGVYYRLEPTFTETVNQVVVQVEEADLAYFDMSEGVLATENKWQDGTVWNFVVAKDIRSNEVFELWAKTLDSTHVPVWTGTDNIVCSGEAYYMMSGVFASDNVVKLSADTDVSAHAYYSLKGNVYAQIMNLATGRPSSELAAAQDALVTAGLTSDVTEKEGDFVLPARYLVGNTTVRYTVTYNGNVSIREAKLAPAGARKEASEYFDPAIGAMSTIDAVPVSLNTVAVDSWSVNSAHFGRVDLNQEGVLNGVINTIQLNGKKVVITVHVDPGQPYTYNNQQYEEKVTGVTMYFQSPTSKEIHGIFSSKDEVTEGAEAKLEWDEATNTATLTIESAAPDSGPYKPGDVLMMQLSTDKKVSLTAFADKEMLYDPVSSGIAIVSDLDYEPQSFSFDVASFAQQLMVTGGSNENGTGSESGYSFGRMPFLAEINVALKIVTDLSNLAIYNKSYKKQADYIIGRLATADAPANVPADDGRLLNVDYDEDGNIIPGNVADENVGGGAGNGAVSNSKWLVAVSFQTKQTYWGGVRAMFAVIASYMGGNAYKNSANPLVNRDKAWNFIKSGRYKMAAPVQAPEWSEAAQNIYGNQDAEELHDGIEAAGDYIYEGVDNTTKGQEIRSEFGGSRFTIGLFFGLYADFGYVVQNGEKSGNLVFMGGGGFGGAKGSAGYTFYSTFFGIPIYVAPEGDIDFTVFAGWGLDPNKTLDAFQSGDTLSMNDFDSSLRIEFTGRLSAQVSFGVGIYKVLGARITAGAGFNAGYGDHMAEWFPTAGTNFGFTTDFTAEGTLDLVVTELNLVSLTFPLPWSAGWMKLAEEILLAKKVIAFTEYGIEHTYDGSGEARIQAKNMADELLALVNDRENANADEIHAKTDALRAYAYENDLMALATYVSSLTTRTDGTLGNILEEFLYRESTIGLVEGEYTDNSAETESGMQINVRTRDHVAAEWVGQKKGLFSTFKPVSDEGTAVLEKDAYSQTAAQILAIGNNKYLMVYLTDNNSRDRQMAGQLVYTIYDASSNTFSSPAAVQNDMTADGKPHLTDAGDKIILTWASIPDEKYAELKETVAEELTPLNEGKVPEEPVIIEELERDPARVMALMEVYVATFDKKSQTFSAIEQLTDDPYYDDVPQAVYDAETGDYIVMYYKSAQDQAKYTESSEKLMDIAGVSADPEKTYSLIGYMLYNNQTDAKDTNGNTHEPGWARDYLFPKETSQDEAGQAKFLAEWKGQRFLPTAAEGMTDPAIGDLTVSVGYNGLAAFAFTVDKDYNLTTGEDRELYMQFYDFSEHGTYVPVKIAGERTENGSTAAVEVGQPKLVRNDGSTWLFWRENSVNLRYLNVSELLNAKVATTAEPTANDWTYALRADGTFATDALTGQVYSPESGKVEFGSVKTGSEFNGTEYDVITDADDNLYVVWSDTVTYAEESEISGEANTKVAQEIYATAMIREEITDSEDSEQDLHSVKTMADESGISTYPKVRKNTSWSKPKRLTTDNNFNDGIALALADDGSLIIVHNQYEKLLADTNEEIVALFESGQIVAKEMNGQKYAVGSLWYNSDNSLVLTRCEPSGSVEVTSSSYSHRYPLPGETIQVYTVIENTGMTSADGCDIVFYENKDGVRGDKIAEFSSTESLAVNEVKSLTFLWEVPEEGADGYRIEAVVTERKAGGGSYEPITTYSEPFVSTTAIDVSIDSVVQNGDVFDITYTVYNRGNRAASEGTEAKIYLSALYGDIKEVYGMDSDLLITEDLSDLGPRETRVITKSVSLPVSVFEFCGYDALEATVTNAEGIQMAVSPQVLFALEAPIHLSLNDGNDLRMTAGDQQQLSVGFETDLFAEVTEISYSVDDTSVASIDENGVITALGKGITTITATLMPSGRTITITLTVLGENGEEPEPTPEPTIEPEPTPTPVPEVKPDDKAPNTYDSYPVKYIWTGACALAVALIALFLRLKNRK